MFRLAAAGTKLAPLATPMLFAAYVSTIAFANWLTTQFHFIPAGFAMLVLAVPAGTYTAGLALGLRDALQDRAGVRWTLAAIAVGTAISYLVADPFIATASGTAFLLAEIVDLLVYTRLRARGWRRALIASNAVGAVVDTLLFLSIAGFPITSQSVGGQLLVKAVFCTGAVLAVREVVRRAVPRAAVNARGA